MFHDNTEKEKKNMAMIDKKLDELTGSGGDLYIDKAVIDSP